MALTMDTTGIACDPSMVDENGNGLPWGLTDPNGLVDVLNKRCEKVLVVDSRSFLEYNTSRIQQSVNVCCSKLVKRRLQQDKVHVRDLLAQSCLVDVDDSWNVIVYDQCTEDPSLFTDDNFVYVLLRKLALSFNTVTFLKGGFLAFQAMHPSLCENKSSCSYKCAPLTSLSQPCLPVSNVGPTRILPFLYLGSQRDALSQETIQVNGINYILNLSINGGQAPFVQDGHFLRIPVNDNYSEQLLPYFYQAFQFIDKVREANGCVLVHCLAGISRSPTLAIAYIMVHMKMSSDEAYRYVKDKRPTISPNFNFLGQLLDFEKQLRQEATETAKKSPESAAKFYEHRPTPFVMDLQMTSPGSPVTRSKSKDLSEMETGFPCGETTVQTCVDVCKETSKTVAADMKGQGKAAFKEPMDQTLKNKTLDSMTLPLGCKILSKLEEEPSKPTTLDVSTSSEMMDTGVVLRRKLILHQSVNTGVKHEPMQLETSDHSETVVKDHMVLESKIVRPSKKAFSLSLSPVVSVSPNFPSTPTSPQNRPVSMDSFNLVSPVRKISRPTSLGGLSLPSSETNTPSTPSKFHSIFGQLSESITPTRSHQLRRPGTSSCSGTPFGLMSPTSAMAKLNFSQTLLEQMETVTVEKEYKLHNFPATSLDKLSFTPCLAGDESPVKMKGGATKRPISAASTDSKSSEPASPMSISSVSSSSSASVPSPVTSKVVLRRPKKQSPRTSQSSSSSPVSETKSMEPSSPMSISSSSSGSSVTSPTATTSKVVLRSHDNKAKRPLVRPNSIAFSTYPTFDLGSDSQDSPTSGNASQDDASEAFMLQNSKKSKQMVDDSGESNTLSEKKFRWGRYSEREVYKQITAAMNSAMMRTRVYEASRKARSLDDILSSEEGGSVSSDCDCTMFGKIPRRCGAGDRFSSPASIFEHLPCRCRGSSDPYQSNSSISSSGSHSSLHGSLEIIQLSNMASSRNHQSRKRLAVATLMTSADRQMLAGLPEVLDIIESMQRELQKSQIQNTSLSASN